MLVLHVDETSIRINQKNHWIHTCTSGDLGLMLVHAKRGQEAIDEINIIPRYGGMRSKDQEGEPHHPVLVHDRWSSYFNYTQCDHSICVAHWQRDLQFIMDAHQHRWAKRMLKLLVKSNREVAENETKVLSKQRYLAVRKQSRRILTQGVQELPALPERKSTKGKPPKTTAE